MDKKLPPKVKQTASDHRLAVEGGTAAWDQPGGKPYTTAPTPKAKKPKPVPGDGMDPMWLPPPVYKKPARVRSENPQKKRKVKLPKQPPNVDEVLQSLIQMPDPGSDIYDALAVVSVFDKPAQKPRSASTNTSRKKRTPAVSPNILFAERMTQIRMLDDVAFDKPPPFRGA